MSDANPELATETVFDAVLTPHRSLGPRGFRLLMAFVIVISAVASARFYVIGAWPVAAFFVVDVALIYLFFKLNYRAAQAREHLHLTHYELAFARVDPRGRRREWRFNPQFVRLARQDHVDFGTLHLALKHRGDEVEIATVLNAAERSDFADALSVALRKAKDGPRFD